MLTRIRDVRRAQGMTLEEVARRCDPPTTAQTIGRLETGMRTISVKWLNRIAAALGVQAGDLMDLPENGSVPVAALVGPEGASAPRRSLAFAAPVPPGGGIGIRVTGSLGDYRAGDQLWCAPLAPERFGDALNCDVLVPRPGGRFLFGRLIGREDDKLHLLSPGIGARQMVVSDPPWIAVPRTLVRAM